MDAYMAAFIAALISATAGSIVSGVVCFAKGAAKARAEAKAEEEAVRKANDVILKCVARAQLEEWHKMYVKDDQPLSMKRHEEIVELHEAYNAKDGNGTGDKLFEELMKVPIEIIA